MVALNEFADMLVDSFFVPCLSPFVPHGACKIQAS